MVEVIVSRCKLTMLATTVGASFHAKDLQGQAVFCLQECLRLEDLEDLALTRKENLSRPCTALSTFSSSWMQWEMKALSTSWDLAQNNCFQMGLQYLISFVKQLESLLRRQSWHCCGLLFSLSREPEQLSFDLSRKLSAQGIWTLQSEVDLIVYMQVVPEKLVRKGPSWNQHCIFDRIGLQNALGPPHHISTSCSELTHGGRCCENLALEISFYSDLKYHPERLNFLALHRKSGAETPTHMPFLHT